MNMRRVEAFRLAPDVVKISQRYSRATQAIEFTLPAHLSAALAG